MRRTDRLFQLVDMLGDHTLHRAEDLARALGVSLRTLYRDIARLQETGVPVTGTRGSGYTLAAATTLPPLTLTPQELETLQLGLAITLQSTDPELRAHAETLAAKIDAALPETTAPDPTLWQAVPNPFADAARGLGHMPILRAAIKARQKLHILYNSSDGDLEQHRLHPQSLTHHARSWVLRAFSEATQRDENFRLDLIEDAAALPELF